MSSSELIRLKREFIQLKSDINSIKSDVCTTSNYISKYNSDLTGAYSYDEEAADDGMGNILSSKIEEVENNIERAISAIDRKISELEYEIELALEREREEEEERQSSQVATGPGAVD